MTDYKSKLENHVQCKLEFVRDKIQLISLKYDETRKMFNRLSLSILVLSAILTLSDAIKLLLTNYIKEDKNNIVFSFDLISLSLGTLLTILSGIIRFKNYRENMERMKELQSKLIDLKAHYTKEQSVLTLMKENDENELIIIENKLEEYSEKLNEVNILTFISNSQMLRYQKYISNYKVLIQEIKKKELEEIEKITNS